MQPRRLAAYALALALLSGAGTACGSFSVMMRYDPRVYVDGLSIGFRPSDGYRYGEYVYWDGLWYYHGIGSPYESHWWYYD